MKTLLTTTAIIAALTVNAHAQTFPADNTERGCVLLISNIMEGFVVQPGHDDSYRAYCLQLKRLAASQGPASCFGGAMVAYDEEHGTHVVGQSPGYLAPEKVQSNLILACRMMLGL